MALRAPAWESERTQSVSWPSRRPIATTEIPRFVSAAMLDMSDAALMITPATDCAARISRYSASLVRSSSELQSITENPCRRATSSTPRQTEVKNGFSMSATTSATIFVACIRRPRATRLGV